MVNVANSVNTVDGNKSPELIALILTSIVELLAATLASTVSTYARTPRRYHRWCASSWRRRPLVGNQCGDYSALVSLDVLPGDYPASPQLVNFQVVSDICWSVWLSLAQFCSVWLSVGQFESVLGQFWVSFG